MLQNKGTNVYFYFKGVVKSNENAFFDVKYKYKYKKKQHKTIFPFETPHE